MFDISWSELLILGLVALIVVGPKELPRFLNTLGKYAGVVKRQANEFRSVFEQAMREAEMEEIRKEVNSVRDGVKASLDEATRSVGSATAAAKVDVAASAPPTQVAAASNPPADAALPPPATEDAPQSLPSPAEVEHAVSSVASDKPVEGETASDPSSNHKAGAA